MNKLEEVLDRIGIEPEEHFTIPHNYTVPNDICNYYTFKYRGRDYCVSADSISIVFTRDLQYIYMGRSYEELEEAIKKELD